MNCAQKFPDDNFELGGRAFFWGFWLGIFILFYFLDTRELQSGIFTALGIWNLHYLTTPLGILFGAIASFASIW